MAKSSSSKTENNRVEIVALCQGKSQDDIITAHKAGQNKFALGIASELNQYANALLKTHPDIEWHFNGTLKPKDIPGLVANPALMMVETIDSIEIAKALHDEVMKHWRGEVEPLNERLGTMKHALDVMVHLDIAYKK